MRTSPFAWSCMVRPASLGGQLVLTGGQASSPMGGACARLTSDGREQSADPVGALPLPEPLSSAQPGGTKLACDDGCGTKMMYFYRTPSAGSPPTKSWASAHPGTGARCFCRGPPRRSWCGGPGAALTCGVPGAAPSAGLSGPGRQMQGRWFLARLWAAQN